MQGKQNLKKTLCHAGDECRVGLLTGKHDQMMPAVRTRQSTTRYQDQHCNDPTYEPYVQETLEKVATQVFEKLPEPQG